MDEERWNKTAVTSDGAGIAAVSATTPPVHVALAAEEEALVSLANAISDLEDRLVSVMISAEPGLRESEGQAHSERSPIRERVDGYTLAISEADGRLRRLLARLEV